MMQPCKSRYTVQSANIEEGHLVVSWGDGHQSRFHPIWLRHQCECDTCGTSLNGVRRIRIHHIPEDIAPKHLSLTEDSVKISWSNDDHPSCYSAVWLRNNCYSDGERKLRKHQPALWDATIADNLPEADFNQACENQQARLAMLQAVCDTGFCKISNAPTEADQSGRLIELVGQQRQTHFGTYTLSKKKSIDNVGDITSALDPHIDETYRLSGIGIVVFQVLHPSVVGGESTLVDGFEAARRLRANFPEDFELLTKVPITTHRLDPAANSGGQPRWFSSSLPVIKLDSDNDICGVRLNERQIAPIDVPAELVGPCYRALRRIFDILYDPDLRLTFKLKAGEGLLFNNQRILHGRSGFTTEEPARSVLTSSVDLEDFYSTLRLLQSTAGSTGPQIAYSQGMAG